MDLDNSPAVDDDIMEYTEGMEPEETYDDDELMVENDDAAMDATDLDIDEDTKDVVDEDMDAPTATDLNAGMQLAAEVIGDVKYDEVADTETVVADVAGVATEPAEVPEVDVVTATEEVVEETATDENHESAETTEPETKGITEEGPVLQETNANDQLSVSTVNAAVGASEDSAEERPSVQPQSNPEIQAAPSEVAAHEGIEATGHEHEDEDDDIQYDDEEWDDSYESILIHIPNIGTRHLFGLPEEEDGSDAPDEAQKPSVCLLGRDDLMDEPLSTFLACLRSELELEGYPSEQEIVLVEKQMDLRMGEDDLNLQRITLMDILTLHAGCGLQDPVEFFVTSEPHRFITRFEAIKHEVHAAEQRTRGQLDSYDDGELGAHHDLSVIPEEAAEVYDEDAEHENELEDHGDEAEEDWAEEEEVAYEEADEDNDVAGQDVAPATGDDLEVPEMTNKAPVHETEPATEEPGQAEQALVEPEHDHAVDVQEGVSTAVNGDEASQHAHAETDPAQPQEPSAEAPEPNVEHTSGGAHLSVVDMAAANATDDQLQDDDVYGLDSIGEAALRASAVDSEAGLTADKPEGQLISKLHESQLTLTAEAAETESLAPTIDGEELHEEAELAAEHGEDDDYEEYDGEHEEEYREDDADGEQVGEEFTKGEIMDGSDEVTALGEDDAEYEEDEEYVEGEDGEYYEDDEVYEGDGHEEGEMYEGDGLEEGEHEEGVPDDTYYDDEHHEVPEHDEAGALTKSTSPTPAKRPLEDPEEGEVVVKKVRQEGD